MTDLKMLLYIPWIASVMAGTYMGRYIDICREKYRDGNICNYPLNFEPNSVSSVCCTHDNCPRTFFKIMACLLL